jgi:hypothetical protein
LVEAVVVNQAFLRQTFAHVVDIQAPAARRRRFCSSSAARCRLAFSTVATSSRRTMTTPSSSATTASPGLTNCPAQSIGMFTEPMVSLTVPWAWTARDHT